MSSPPTQTPGDGDPGENRRRSSRYERSGRSAFPATYPAVMVAVVVVVATVLAVSAFLIFRYFTAEVFSASRTSMDSVASGSSPEITLTNTSGSVTVTSDEGLNAVKYEMTGYGTARNEAAARERAAEVEAVVQRREAEGESPMEIDLEASGGDGAYFTLRVPAGANVNVTSGAGPVEISGLTGDAYVESRAGDVTVRGMSGSVDIESGAGDVTVEDVTGETGSVGVVAESGDVSLSDLVVATMQIEVATGSVMAGGRFSGEGEVLVETGNILLEVPQEDTRNVSFETRVGEVVRPDGEED